MATAAKAPSLERTLEGEVVCLTKLAVRQEQFDQISAHVRARGGELTSDLTAEANTVLVAGEGLGAKVDFARVHGIPCVDPAWLLAEGLPRDRQDDRSGPCSGGDALGVFVRRRRPPGLQRPRG
jgi:hypothetical protein